MTFLESRRRTLKPLRGTETGYLSFWLLFLFIQTASLFQAFGGTVPMVDRNQYITLGTLENFSLQLSKSCKTGRDSEDLWGKSVESSKSSYHSMAFSRVQHAGDAESDIL